MFRMPLKKKKFWREEALFLRTRYLKLIPTHLFQLIVCDMYVYNFEVLSIVFNVLLLWLDYVNFMTLNKMSCFLQIGLLYLSTFVALSHAQRVFMNDPYNGTLIFCYIL